MKITNPLICKASLPHPFLTAGRERSFYKKSSHNSPKVKMRHWHNFYTDLELTKVRRIEQAIAKKILLRTAEGLVIDKKKADRS